MSNMFSAIQLAIKALQTKLSKIFAIESQKGLTIIEYAFLGLLIATALIASLQMISDKTVEMYVAIGNAFL